MNSDLTHTGNITIKIMADGVMAAEAKDSALQSKADAQVAAQEAQAAETAAEGYATAAGASAQTAQAEASTATEAAQDAQTAKTAAAESEQAAEASKTTAVAAAEEAQAAQTAAQTAQGLSESARDTSTQNATLAAASQTAAALSATQAGQYADSAGQSATTATQQATAAGVSEGNAAASATAAQTAATNAANVAKDYLQRSTAYTAGDIVPAADSLSKAYALLCTGSTTAGVTPMTGTTAPTAWAAIGSTTTDGTAVFMTIARRPTTRDQSGLTDIYTKTEVNSLVSMDKNIYGSSFDGVNSTGTRLYASSGLSWSPSTDIAAGTDQFTGKSVWDGFDVLVKYDSSTSTAKIVAYEGTSAFDTYKNDDSYGADVFHMFPKGYFRRIATDSVGAETKLVSTKNFTGFTPSPMHFRDNVLYDYIGVTKYGWCDNGNGGICSRSGKPPKINITESQFETLSRAKGLRVAGINDISWIQHIGCIKYNSLNWQTTVGRGVVDIYAYAKATVSETGVSRVIVSNSDATKFSVGALVHVVSSGVWWPITSIAAYDANNMAITAEAGTTFNTTAGTTTIETSCIYSGGTDTVLGVDGAASAGKDGWRSVLTMGIENLYGNTWKLLGGICRIGSTLYVNPSPDTQYAWPSTAADAATKGWVQYAGTYCASTGYIKAFGYDANYPHILIPATVGGDSNKPVGDYYYTNTDTDAKIARFGGGLDYGSFAGPFCVYLDNGVGSAYWDCGALGVFIPS